MSGHGIRKTVTNSAPRAIGEAYQLDVKGYRVLGYTWQEAKKDTGVHAPIRLSEDELWNGYLSLWRQFAEENPDLVADLMRKSSGKVLTDMFASSSVSQARAWAVILSEKNTRVFTANYFTAGIENMKKVRISLTQPKNVTVNCSWLAVAPQWNDLLGSYKDGVIDDAEYTSRYMKILESNKASILQGFKMILEQYTGRDIVLLCWCKKGNFCHRRLLADWLVANGAITEIREL